MTPAEEAMLRWMRQGRALAERAVAGEGGRLADVEGFGDNPGALGARVYLPEGLPPGAPLVVVLHGCTQQAAGYDRGAGWSTLAARHGFALLYPEQQPANNANLCFNWFRPLDIARDGGEVASIRQMIGATVAAHRLDPARVFVTGLSAGGAMTMAMIATCPEMFAGAAVIAGLPYGCARTPLEAIDRMAGRGMPPAATLTRTVLEASPYRGPWPLLSVWHGDADRVVAPAAAGHIVDQWRGVLGIGPAPDLVEPIGRHRRSVWRDAAGRTLIERYAIAGMDHGVPLDPDGPDGCGATGPFMLDAGISSTAVIARSWGLTGPAPSSSVRPPRHGLARLLEDAARVLGLTR
ncbi:MAG TPA: PHB depolymerase family esterase [Sphingomonas sp.]